MANGWYNREMAEVQFWKQSNHLVRGPKLWETLKAKDAEFTCAKLFWWYNMYSSADIGVTPRPMYPADGRKIPDCYAAPSELRDLVVWSHLAWMGFTARRDPLVRELIEQALSVLGAQLAAAPSEEKDSNSPR